MKKKTIKDRTPALWLLRHLYCLCTIKLTQYSTPHFSHESIYCSRLVSLNSSLCDPSRNRDIHETLGDKTNTKIKTIQIQHKNWTLRLKPLFFIHNDGFMEMPYAKARY